MNPITDKSITAKWGRRLMRWTRRVLLICGTLALAYVGLILVDARIYQKNAQLDPGKADSCARNALTGTPEASGKGGRYPGPHSNSADWDVCSCS